MATRLLLFVFFVAIASAEIHSWVKTTNKDPPPSTAPASARRATVTNTQYAVNGIYPGSDSYGAATLSQAGSYTTTLASSAYGGAGSGVSMTVDTTTATVKMTGSGSVTDCATSVSAYQAQTFVGTTMYTTTNTAPTACSDTQHMTFGDTLTDTSKGAIMLSYSLIRSSSTTLATYIKNLSTGTVASLLSGAGQTTGDAVATVESANCGTGAPHRVITVLSTVTLSTSADWDAAAAQSIYTPLDFTINCGTIPMIAIIGLEGTAAQAVCSGCATSSVSNPATKVQASIMSILLLSLLVIGIGRL